MNTRVPKLGLIVPSLNSVMECEMQRMAGGTASIHTMRVSAHTTGMGTAVGTRENLLWMDDEAPRAATLLAHARVDVICFGCTAGGVVNDAGRGAHADRAIIDAIVAAAGVPATVTSTASCDALRALGVTRMSVASPYEPWQNDYLRTFLETSDFEVCAIDGFGSGGVAVGPHNAAAVTSEQVATLARAVDRREAQAIFISCTNFHTLDIIEPLERELGKPVLTATSASMWKMLRLAGDGRDVPGGGKLFGVV